MPGVNWLEEIELLFLEKSRQSTSLIENLHVPSSGLPNSSASHGGNDDDETWNDGPVL